MPQEPKKKHSKSRKRIRRGSISLTAAGILMCSNCNNPILPHQVCPACGFYNGKKVIQKTKATVTKA